MEITVRYGRARRDEDLIEVYEMINKLSNVNFEIFESDTNRSTRGHSLKLKKKRFNTELR